MSMATTPRTAAGVMRGPERTMSSFDLRRVNSDLSQLAAAQRSDTVADQMAVDGAYQMIGYYSRLAQEPVLARVYAQPSAFSPVGKAALPLATSAEPPLQKLRGGQRRSASPSIPGLTPLEKRVWVCVTVNNACSAAAAGMTGAAGLQVKLALVGGDLGASAVATATLISTVSAFSLVLQPIVGSASDTLGRKPFMLLEPVARMGWFYFLSSPAYCTSINRYLVVAVLNFGVLGAGGHLIKEAAMDDLFGQRASLRAEVQARSNFYSSVLNTISPVIGAKISRRSNWGAHFLGIVLVCIQALSTLLLPETLKVEERRPFKVRAANPLSNMAVLFTHSPALRGFAIINFLYNFANGCNQNKGEYAMTAMGWVPQDISYLESFVSLVNVFSQRTVVMRMIRKYGAKGAFVNGSLFSATAYLLISIAWFPPSASKLQKTMVMIAGHLIWAGGHVGPLALRTLTIKQGLSVKPPLGRGELNAALKGVESIVGMTSPLIWGRLFRFFSSTGHGSWWYNPGGAFLLAGLGRIGIRVLFQLMCRVYAADLMIDD